jgi:hypothetical protein
MDDAGAIHEIVDAAAALRATEPIEAASHCSGCAVRDDEAWQIAGTANPVVRAGSGLSGGVIDLHDVTSCAMLIGGCGVRAVFTGSGRRRARPRPTIRRSRDRGSVMARKVPVTQISSQRLAQWLADCERDQATPLVLVAMGHDEQAGTLHVYRPEDGPDDTYVGLLLEAAVLELKRGHDG